MQRVVIVLALGACGDRGHADPEPVQGAPPAVAAGAPTSGPVLANVDDLVAGLDHTCALAGGRVLCWGRALDGGAPSRLARAVAGLPPIRLVRAGGRQTCVVGTQGELACWGEVLGRSDGEVSGQVQVLEPGQGLPASLGIEWGPLARLDYGAPIATVAVGLTHACALTAAHRLYCWGFSSGGQLGAEYVAMARPELEGEHVDDVEAGHGWTCTTEKTKRTCRGSPADVDGAPRAEWTQFAGWHLAACGVTADGRVRCSNSGMRVWGDKPMPGTDEPGEVAGLEHVDQLVLGANHACARNTDGSVWCWGDNTAGQVTSDTGHRAVQRVSLPGAARKIVAGEDHTCALLEPRGEVACWGRDDFQQGGVAPALIHVDDTPRPAVAIPTVTVTTSASRR